MISNGILAPNIRCIPSFNSVCLVFPPAFILTLKTVDVILQGSRVRPIWSHVRPNFSRVRLKKSEGAPVRPAVREEKKKYPRLWVSLCFYNRHTLGSYRGLISEIINGSLSPIRESEGRTPNVCLWCIFAIPKSDARSLTWRSFSTCNMKALFMIEEN